MEEVDAVDGLLGQPESLWEGGERHPADDHVAYGGRSVRSRRHLLLPVLHAMQDRTGWVSRGALEYACRRLSIPPAEAYGVVSFHARFALQPRGAMALHVCDDIACKCAGADELCAALEKDFGAPGGAWHRSPCLGLCDRAPAALVERAGSDHEERQIAPITLEGAEAVLRGRQWPSTSLTPTLSPSGRGRLLRRGGGVGPPSIDSYLSHGGFGALRRARQMGAEAVVREVTQARVLRPGGAPVPTRRQWGAGASAGGQTHHPVFNAGEAEARTVKGTG